MGLLTLEIGKVKNPKIMTLLQQSEKLKLQAAQLIAKEKLAALEPTDDEDEAGDEEDDTTTQKTKAKKSSASAKSSKAKKAAAVDEDDEDDSDTDEDDDTDSDDDSDDETDEDDDTDSDDDSDDEDSDEKTFSVAALRKAMGAYAKRHKSAARATKVLSKFGVKKVEQLNLKQRKQLMEIIR